MASDVKKSLRSQLRKILGTETGDEAHHLIPLEHMDDEFVQYAAEGGFHMNLPENGMNILSAKLGGEHAVHPNLNRQVKQILSKLKTKDYTPEAAAEILVDVTTQMREQLTKFIADNPGKLIDEIKLNVKIK